MSTERLGLVLGTYEVSEKGSDFSLSAAAQHFQAQKAAGLSELITNSGLFEKKGGKCRVFYGLGGPCNAVAIVKVGKKEVGYNEKEEVDEGKENVRTAVACAVKSLHDQGIMKIAVDPCGDAEAAAEGAILSTFNYDELKGEDNKKPAPEVSCYVEQAEDKQGVQTSWERGRLLAEGQNLARLLMETPANYMTPTRFCQVATERLAALKNVEVRVRDQAWAESMKMGSFLSVSRGSEEPPKFLELEYKGGAADLAPIALVGKGVTFDSGGISIKPAANMDDMRADMGGAACVLSAFYTAARMQLPVNIMCFMPLTENMPSGKATKPGDVVTAMNGKTIQVDNTDAEGRLILCDALCYAQTFNPRAIIDMATLTGAMMVALGGAAAGAFTHSKTLWETMHQSGSYSGDRVWRMPLYKSYAKKMKVSPLADLVNTAGRAGGSCNAAGFLKEFVKTDEWLHLDIAGVMKNGGEVSYLGKGMSGRPTRTIVEFLNRFK